MIKAAILGANGYTGLELINILRSHSKVRLTQLISRSNEGAISEVYPSLTGSGLSFCRESDTVDADVVFCCLPHTLSAASAPALLKQGIKVIDLSSDFRYDDAALYESTYNVVHPHKELNAEAVYGMPELFRDKIKSARIVGNPGCYTTAAILPLFPLLEANAVDPDSIIIDAKSGISGAGRKAELGYIYTETAENFKAYGVTTHRHTTEIEEKLSIAAGKKISLTFTPHLLPVKRGILSTMYMTLNKGVTEADIAAVYAKKYGSERFVQILGAGNYPELKYVCGSNNIMIGFKADSKTGRLIVISALDNLTKGASGQAVQNMNIMFGFSESEGLDYYGKYI